jgi:peptide-methionine (S)-S-oxide reductase
MSDTEFATIGGGCFWCTEAVFLRLRGVKSVVSGYAGGQVDSPTYESICQGTTGHAEVIQIEFDPAEIMFVDLLDVFFATHDPTTLNQQGADRGTQYRSVIFFRDEQQKQLASQKIAELNDSGEFAQTIVTEVTQLPTFYSAEDYHQDYFRRNPQQPYCSIVVVPKVQKLLDRFGDRLK